MSNLELVVQTKDFLHVLNFANSIVEKRNVLSELNNIKLVAKNNNLEIGATDMDLYLKQDIGAEIISEGETTVSTQTISDIIRKIPDSEITLKQLSPDKLQILGKNCSFELVTLPALRFPPMEDINSESSLTISCKELARLIEYTSFAVSTEETRYNLNGIYMHVKEKEFCAASTDGHRLSVASTKLSKLYPDFGVIVPRKTVLELSKIIKDNQNIHSELDIILSTNKIKFVCNNLILISKLIDGTFPEYHSFIPQENENKLKIHTKLLANAIDRISTVTVDKFRAIKISINKNMIEITASGEAKGMGKETLLFSDEDDTYCKFDGSEVSIGFNPKYISDILSVLNYKTIDLYFKDSFSPILIKNEENSKDNFVVMPIKI